MDVVEKCQVNAGEEAEFCVDLCDVLLGVASPDDLEALLERVRAVAGAAHIDRLYLGSYLCPTYFADVCGDPLDVALRWCAVHGVQATLVVPVVSEGEFERVAARVDDALGRTWGVGAGFLGELSVNDLGMARHAARTWCADGCVGLCLGRVFDKAPRDPRYAEAFAGERVVDADELVGLAGLGAAVHLVRCIEVEPTNDALCVLGGRAAVAVHEPYACLTLGRVCEFAGVGRPPQQAFRPGGPCSRACVDARVRYALHDGVELLRVGKGVYARHGCVVRGDLGAGALRKVYWPLDEVPLRA